MYVTNPHIILNSKHTSLRFFSSILYFLIYYTLHLLKRSVLNLLIKNFISVLGDPTTFKALSQICCIKLVT